MLRRTATAFFATTHALTPTPVVEAALKAQLGYVPPNLIDVAAWNEVMDAFRLDDLRAARLACSPRSVTSSPASAPRVTCVRATAHLHARDAAVTPHRKLVRMCVT